MITAERIKRFAPRARADIVAAIVENWSAAEKIGITKPRRVRHFLARVAVETRGFTALEESLTYTTFKALHGAWPARFPNEASAAPYIRQPKKLAIKVYGGRLGNRAAPSTDGWDNRGSGMLQSTGAENIKETGYTAEQLRQPVPAFLSALSEWKKRGCNVLADRDDAAAVCKAIQGGTGGLDQQKVWLAKGKKIWPDDMEDAAAPSKKGVSDPSGGMTKYEIEALQRQLQEALYTETGNIDGLWGSRTTAAISAFQADNKLPITGSIDDATRAFMIKHVGIPKRVIPAARANATAESLKEQGNLPAAAQEAEKGLFWSKLQAIGGVVSGVVYGVWDYVDDAIGAVSPLKDNLADMAPWVFIAAVVGVSGVLYLRNRQAVTAAVTAVRKGQDTGV